MFSSWIAGSFIAIVAGPLGSFVIWSKMSYFGETLAHISLLGLALSLWWNIDPFYSILIITILLSWIIILMENTLPLYIDSILGILAQSCLSIGIVIISIASQVRKEKLINYLLGDLSTVTPQDIITLGVIISMVLLIIYVKWTELLSVIINPELAHVEGIAVKKVKILLILLLAITIAVSIKFVGALLITSMLIIPAAAAQLLSRSPEQMVIMAIIMGIASVTIGSYISFLSELPAGPTIVVNATIIFIITLIIKISFNKKITHLY
ncbi:MAG: iron chelate uptake ABC transporter family permease subunit [Candidatus Dasytiphilus stammeri]